jgi:hypothetical protein
MLTRYRFVVVAMVLCLQLAFAVTASAFVAWSNQSGTGTNFEWVNGGSDNGLFGDPLLVGGDTFTFIPSGFRAESTDGLPHIATDRMQVDLAAYTGHKFTEIRITETGDYGILGQGSVEIAGTVTAHDLFQLRSRSDSLVATPGSPIESGFGTWTATTTILLDDAQEWTRLTLELQNDLLAVAAPGSASFIETKFLGGELSIQVLPEPGALALLSFGAVTFIRHRRIRS